MYSTKDLGADTWLGTASYWAGSFIIQAFSGTRKNPTGCFCDLYPLKSMRKSFSVRTDIPQKVPIVFKQRAGDLFMFEIKKGMYKFSQKCTKRPKNCTKFGYALIVLSATKVCIFCNFWDTIAHILWFFLLKSERITGSMMENLTTKWFSNIWNPQYITEEGKKILLFATSANF